MGLIAIIGGAFIRVSPETGTFGPEVQRQVSTQLAGVRVAPLGNIAGQQYGSALAAGAQSQIASQMAPTSGFGTQFKNYARRYFGFLAIGTAARAAFQFIGQGVQQLAELEALQAQTEAAIKSTGGAANVSAGEIRDMAQAMEDLTTIEEEQIQRAANMILTFKNVKNVAGEGNDIFDQTVSILADVGVAMGTDTASAAIQLGKALNDPVAGMAALRRIGVTFSADQEKQIEGFVESNQLMEAQKIILAELNDEFGGSAEAMGGTLRGSINRINDAWGDMQKQVAENLTPAIKGLATIMSHPVFEFFAGHFAAITGEVVKSLIPLLKFAEVVERITGGADLDESVGKDVEKLAERFADGTATVDDLRKRIVVLSTALGQLGTDDAAAEEIRVLIDNLKDLIEASEDGVQPLDDLGDAEKRQKEALKAWREEIQDAREDAKLMAQAQRDIADAHDEASRAARAQVSAELDLASGFLGLASSSLDAKEAQRRLLDARGQVERLERQGRTSTLNYQLALEDLQRAQIDAAGGQIGIHGAVADYITELSTGKTSQTEVNKLLAEMGAQGLVTGEEIAGLQSHVQGLIGEYDQLPTNKRTIVEIADDIALRKIANIEEKLKRATRDRTAKIDVELTQSAGATVTPGSGPTPLPGGESGLAALANIVAAVVGGGINFNLDGHRVGIINQTRDLALSE